MVDLLIHDIVNIRLNIRLNIIIFLFFPFSHVARCMRLLQRLCEENRGGDAGHHLQEFHPSLEGDLLRLCTHSFPILPRLVVGDNRICNNLTPDS